MDLDVREIEALERFRKYEKMFKAGKIDSLELSALFAIAFHYSISETAKVAARWQTEAKISKV